MRADESPEADLKERYRLARAAPASEASSEWEPAEGKVREVAEMAEESSVTIVRPHGRVDVEAVLPFFGVGTAAETPGNFPQD